MTKAELAGLLRRRAEAWQALPSHVKTPLRDYDPAERAEVERLSREYREADAAITAELVRRKEPVRLGGVTLWLTADRLNFVTLDTASREPLYGHERFRMSRNTLLDYAQSA